MILMVLWATFTWIFFGGLIVFLILRPDATWIGFYICVVMTAWSIILRVIEFSRVKPAIINEDNVTSPDEDVAMFILGRNHSAFILCGSRINLKTWTSSGPIYRDDSSMLLSKQTLQIITRAGSLIVLLLYSDTRVATRLRGPFRLHPPFVFIYLPDCWRRLATAKFFSTQNTSLQTFVTNNYSFISNLPYASRNRFDNRMLIFGEGQTRA